MQFIYFFKSQRMSSATLGGMPGGNGRGSLGRRRPRNETEGAHAYGAAEWSKSDRVDTTNSVDTVLLPPFQIVSHSKNFRESNFF